MASTAGQLIERGKSRWLVRVYVGRDAAGKRKYLNKTVHGNEKAAQAVLTQMLRENTGTLIEPSRLSLGDDLEHWLETAAKPRLSPRSYRGYKSLLKRCVRPELGDERPTALSPVGIRALYSKMLERKLSARTVRYTRTVLKNALEQAVKWRMTRARTPPNMLTSLDLPKQERQELTALSEEEAQRFLAVAEGSRYHLLFNYCSLPACALARRWASSGGTSTLPR